MGLVDTLLAPAPARADRLQAAIPPADTLTTLDSFFGARTDAGQFVDYDRALTLTAVLACVRILADSIGGMRLETYLETSEGARQAARNRPVYTLLRDSPNPEMTASDCWGTVAGHLSLDGNSFIGKQFDDRTGLVKSLWPIQPNRVRVAREGKRLVFYVRDEYGVETRYTQDEIIHIRGLSIDGIRGVSPISLARQAIGAGLAMDQYSNKHWQQGAMPSAVLQTDKDLEPGVAEKLARRAQRLYGGTKNRGKIMVLEDGVKWEQVSLSAQDTGFLDQYRVGVEQVARIFRMPLSKLQAIPSGDSNTYKNLEMDQLQFWTDAVMPWALRIEQALRADPDLFPDWTLHPEFVPDSLLRADALTRAKVNQIAVAGAAYKLPSEVRPGEGLGPSLELDDLALTKPKQPPPAAPAADPAAADTTAAQGR